MRRIVRTSRGDALVLAVTFLSTLALQLEFAIFVGVLASLLVYLQRTTHPHLTPVVPDRDVAAAALRRRCRRPGRRCRVECPQLALLRVDGSLFFGAVEHVRDELHDARVEAPERRDILLIGSGINFIDVAGAELLAHEAKLTREAGGTLYLCNLKPAVHEAAGARRVPRRIGRDRVFDTKDDAIRQIYARLDSAICRDLRGAHLHRVRVDAAGRIAAGRRDCGRAHRARPGAGRRRRAHRCRTQSM